METSKCELCGEEMTEQDGTMFRYHGYARDCPNPPLKKKGINIEPYLREELKNGAIDFSLRAHIENGSLYIYIHPQGKDGKTMDYEVKDDQLFLRY